MTSLLLSASSKILLPLMLLYSLFVLIQGHNAPGGGFIAGLIAAASLSLFAFSEGLQAAKNLLKIEPRNLAAMGLLIAVASVIYPTFFDQLPMTGIWGKTVIPGIGKLGTTVF